MLWKVWAAIGGIAVGVAIAALLGSGAPLVMEVVLLAAAAAGVLVTVVSSISRRRRMRWRYAAVEEELPRRHVPRVTGHDVHQPDVPRTTDAVAAERLASLVGQREVWLLGSDGFSSPWLETDVTRLRELAQVTPRLGAMTDPAVAVAASELVATAKAFIAVYDATTVPDPITGDGRWRMVADPALLRELEDAAARLLRSHEALAAAMPGAHANQGT